MVDPAGGTAKEPDREFRLFSFRDAHYRINSPAFSAACREIKRMRNRLEEYIRELPLFASSFTPLETLPGKPPESALIMHEAALLTGTGPMAAVAGTFAQGAAEAAIRAGAPEAIVDNGGDLFLILQSPATIGLYTGKADRSPFNTLALHILPDQGPLAVCSSSSTMGHSMSLGKAELVTVISASGALADAAATLGANMVGRSLSIQEVAEEIVSITGIAGVLIFQGGEMALVGSVPELVHLKNADLPRKVVKAPESNFPG
jgi:ApbE superfamily uncharacterized protein (UPF0280 family)